jgi:hypothetical protein
MNALKLNTSKVDHTILDYTATVELPKGSIRVILIGGVASGNDPAWGETPSMVVNEFLDWSSKLSDDEEDYYDEFLSIIKDNEYLHPPCWRGCPRQQGSFFHFFCTFKILYSYQN